MKNLRVLSLFSGCGGMDLGLEGGFIAPKASIDENRYSKFIERTDDKYVYLKHTRFETVFSNDILPSAQKAWCNFFKKDKSNADEIFHLESIVDLVKQHDEGNFSFPENIDVVTGGFPCQDFSVAGKRKGFDSHKDHNGNIYDEPTEATRGKLYLWMKRVIEITKPKLFIAENVKGLVSLGDVKEMIQSDFRNIDDGYIVLDAKVLNAKNYGVAQNRERIIFIGISKRYAKPLVIKDLIENGENSKFYPYPIMTHGEGEGLKPFVKLREIIGHLPEPEETTDESQKAFSKAKLFKNSQGNIEVNLDSQSPTIRAEHHGNIEFRRLSKENGGKNLQEYHLAQRRLTIRECALIQSFPPNYDFVFNYGKLNTLSASAAYKIIGNAVPPLLAFALAVHLSEIWEEIF